MKVIETVASPVMRYSIVDSDPPLLQKTELLRINGNWHYWRCPKSGLEWHTNGNRVGWHDTPWYAWWWYIYFQSYALCVLHDEIASNSFGDKNNEEFLAKFDDWTFRVTRCSRQLRFAAKVYSTALADSLDDG